MIDVTSELAERAVLTIRMLSADAVQKANSGHPGMPLGAADYAFVLWARYLRFYPSDPQWPNRDRFVLSAGHGSILLYSLLHLSGFDLPMQEIQSFRQWGSMTPGHPEYGCAPGVETTTGPLGQGFGNGVGMALAARMFAARVNRPGYDLINHRVFAIVSDGDLMEGVASEAASLAGHLKLGNLIYIYDDNRVSIEGSTELAFSEDVARRFEAYGWHVQAIDGHDRQAAADALEAAISQDEQPSLIIARTRIARGAPTMEDNHEAHGAPLGEDEIREMKARAGWPIDLPFFVPDDVRELFAARRAELQAEYADWQKRLTEYRRKFPDAARLWDALLSRRVPEDLVDQLLAAAPVAADATRNLSGKVLQRAAELVPSLCGGSADLGPSTKTILAAYGDIAAGQFDGRNLHFGVREHGMGAIVNGMALYGAFLPFAATFLVFSDYMRPTIRLAALMRIPVIFVLTHDSIFAGEDGPTHQPVEQAAALRAIPNLYVFRPADGPEVAAAWGAALMRRDGPSALLLTRQTCPALDRQRMADARGLLKGAYVLHDYGSQPDLILIASGSEVGLAVEVAEHLAETGRAVRVVSMPCWELFDQQAQEYRDQVLPPTCSRRVVIEAGVRQGWERYGGHDGLYITMERFGASAPYQVLAEKFGFTPDAIVHRIQHWTTCRGDSRIARGKRPRQKGDQNADNL